MQTKKSVSLYRLIVIGVLAMLAPVGVWAQTVVINEVMADNQTAFQNGSTFPDYVELLNISSTVSVPLTGYRLTDNTNNLFKFVFPAGSPTLAPGERLVVFADSETNAPGIHLDFGLSGDGEDLRLLNSSGVQIDAVLFGLQLPDYSIGRVPDGSANWVLTAATPDDPNVAVPMGTTGSLFINEWMALWGDDPVNNPDDDWLELYNGENLPVAIGGLFLSDGPPNAEDEIVPLSFIGPLGFRLFIADNSPEKGADHLPYRLSSTNGEDLTLLESDQFDVIDTISFPGGQEANRSEGRLPDGSTNIIRFPIGRDTPEKSNSLLITNVVFNEVLAHTDPPYSDAIELYNPTASPVDIGNYWLSDDRTEPMKYRIPANTIIPANGYVVFYQFTHFDPFETGVSPYFTLNSFEGEEINLFSADASGALTGSRLREEFPASANAVSFGRHVNSDGDVDFVATLFPSFGVANPPASIAVFETGAGAPNPGPLVGPVVISEIMYHPPDIIVQFTNIVDNSDDEYVELYNITTNPVPLFHPVYTTNAWKLKDAVSFSFPTGPDRITLPPGGTLLVVNFDPKVETGLLGLFKAKYGIRDTVPILGPYGGKLQNGGDSVELARPDNPQNLDGFVPFILVDRVNYNDKAPWPVAPDGTGAALERYPVESYGNDPINWRGVAPTPGRHTIPLISKTLVGTTMTLEFEGQAGSSYSLLIKDEFAASPAWTKLAGSDKAPELTTGMRTVVDNTVPVLGSRLYQVVSPAQ